MAGSEKEVATTRMGPNDAGRIIWAISKFFFRVFCMLTKFSVY